MNITNVLILFDQSFHILFTKRQYLKDNVIKIK